MLKLALLVVLFFCTVAKATENLQCIQSPDGQVDMTVSVLGSPGPEGPPGPQGEIGPFGEKGPRGEKGRAGKKGLRGIAGPKGDVGPQGGVGEPGPQGDSGPPGSDGPPGGKGSEGPQGPEGKTGAGGPGGTAGPAGPQGPPGETGSSEISDADTEAMTSSVQNAIMEKVNMVVRNECSKCAADIAALNATIQAVLAGQAVQQPPEKIVHPCGIEGNWRKVASLDTTAGDECPAGLQTFTNDTTGQHGCGRQTVNTIGSCDSVKYPVAGPAYTEVCGRMKGYQLGFMVAFEAMLYKDVTPGIEDSYVDGVSVTYGSSPRKHLWTNAVGISETHPEPNPLCPCAKPDGYNFEIIPDFIGEHYYCESGTVETLPPPWFSGSVKYSFLWEDPLWDGEGCETEGNKCCERSGWFHRTIPETSDGIELRLCSISGNVALEQVEIYVN